MGENLSRRGCLPKDEHGGWEYAKQFLLLSFSDSLLLLADKLSFIQQSIVTFVKYQLMY